MPATISATLPASSTTNARTVVVLIVGVVVTVIANSVIAIAAMAAGASSAFSPLAIYVYGPFTVIGFVVAYSGWLVVRRRALRPAAALRVLVPVLTVLSFAPDTILALTRFIPGTSLTAVVGLALMHLLVVAVAIPVSARLAPVR
jgi:hypothetical protein